jgi:hypothetical protein
MRIKDILEASFRKPHLMYHGTTTKFLRSILKNGVVPNPKEKRWDTDQPSQGIFTRASLYGSYWTSDIITSISAAGNTKRKFGGERVIVIAKIAEQSAYEDEDQINRYLHEAMGAVMRTLAPNTRSNFYLPIAHFLWDLPPHDLKHQQARQVFRDTLHGLLAKNTDLHTMDQDFLDTLMDTLVMRAAVWEKKHGMDLTHWIRNVPEHLPSTTEIEDRLQALREKLTRTYRKHTLHQDVSFFHTLRMPMVVGYSGSNKILALIEYIPSSYTDSEPTKTKLILHYGTPSSIPQEFFDQYLDKIGPFPGIFDTNGNMVVNPINK